MDTGLRHKDLLTLNPGEVLRLRDPAGRHLGVVRGSVWITQHGDRRDAVVEGGDSFRFDHGGIALAQPLGGAAVVVLEAGLVPERAGTAAGPARPAGRETDAVQVHRLARRLRAAMLGDAIAAAARRLHCNWLRARAAVSRWAAGPRPARRAKWISGALGLSDYLLHDIGLWREQIAWFGRTPGNSRRARHAAPCGPRAYRVFGQFG